LIFSAGFHFAINSGSSIAEATNFVFDEWVTHRSTFPMTFVLAQLNTVYSIEKT
jgi:hypothetical protein